MRRTTVMPQSGCRPAMRFILALRSSVPCSATRALAYWITSSARPRRLGGTGRGGQRLELTPVGRPGGYDLRLGSHPRSPSRYLGCLTFSHWIALRDRDRMARSECHLLKGAAILAKRDLAFGAAVQVVKHRFRYPATRQRPQILDADDTRGCDLLGRPRHLQLRVLESFKTGPPIAPPPT